MKGPLLGPFIGAAFAHSRVPSGYKVLPVLQQTRLLEQGCRLSRKALFALKNEKHSLRRSTVADYSLSQTRFPLALSPRARAGDGLTRIAFCVGELSLLVKMEDFFFKATYSFTCCGL